jgi:hypothetical protein
MSNATYGDISIVPMRLDQLRGALSESPSSSRRVPPRPDDCFATHPSVSLDEAGARFRHLGGSGGTLASNGMHALPPPVASARIRPGCTVTLGQRMPGLRRWRGWLDRRSQALRNAQ